MHTDGNPQLSLYSLNRVYYRVQNKYDVTVSEVGLLIFFVITCFWSSVSIHIINP